MRFAQVGLYHLLQIALLMTALVAGCRDRGADHYPNYENNHPVASEERYYNRWEQETHREHQDLSKRTTDEQKQYYDWRRRQH